MCKLGQKKLKQIAERLQLPLVAGYVVSHTEYIFLAEFAKNGRWLEFTWNPQGGEFALRLKRKWVREVDGAEGSTG